MHRGRWLRSRLGRDCEGELRERKVRIPLICYFRDISLACARDNCRNDLSTNFLNAWVPHDGQSKITAPAKRFGFIHDPEDIEPQKPYATTRTAQIDKIQFLFIPESLIQRPTMCFIDGRTHGNLSYASSMVHSSGAAARMVFSSMTLVNVKEQRKGASVLYPGITIASRHSSTFEPVALLPNGKRRSCLHAKSRQFRIQSEITLRR
jgi:hypothetical protein